jgi:hypothetical protein
MYAPAFDIIRFWITYWLKSVYSGRADVETSAFMQDGKIVLSIIEAGA